MLAMSAVSARLWPLRARARAAPGAPARAATSSTGGGGDAPRHNVFLRFDTPPARPPAAYPSWPLPAVTTTQEKLHAHCLRDLARLGVVSPQRMARGRFTPFSHLSLLYYELIHKTVRRAFAWGVPSEEALAAVAAEVAARCGGAGVACAH
jgi:hypothetical protein